MPKQIDSVERRKWRAYFYERSFGAQHTPLTHDMIKVHAKDWQGTVVDPERPETEAIIDEIRETDIGLRLPGGKLHACPNREIVDAENVIRYWIARERAPAASDFRKPNPAIGIRPIHND